VSDFVHNLVLRAAGLATGVSARPPFQPSFAPDLPTVRRPAAPSWTNAISPANRQAQPAEVPAPPPAHRPQASPSPSPEPPVLSVPREAPREAPLAGRSASESPAPHSGITPPAPEALVSDQAGPQPQPQVQQDSPAQSPESVRADRLSPRPGGDVPVAKSTATAAPGNAPPESVHDRLADTKGVNQFSLASDRSPAPGHGRGLQTAWSTPSETGDHVRNRTERPRQPATLDVDEAEFPPMSLPGSQAVISPARAPVPTERESVTVEPGPPLRAEPLPLVQPAPAPPPRLLAAPLAPPSPVTETAPAVQVRIGTVEVRASQPVPPAPLRSRPQPLGFDDYAHLRGLGWE
jgi:hypothetical protein